MNDNKPSVSIVVPAFREAPNIEPLVRRIFDSLGGTGIDAEVIIVDDDSRDGTVEIVRRLAEAFPVRVVVRSGQRGLASAVLRGFAEAAHDILVVMDADLQHPPEAIVQLVEPIAAGRADFVLGSRYVGGGRIAENWSFLRRLNSWGATVLARPLVALRDPMSGFFALRRAIWEQASATINPIGYKIALELAVKTRPPRVQEVPIVFGTRHAGTTKLTLREQGRYLRHLAHLYWFRYRALIVALAVLALIIVGFLIIV